MSTLTDKRPLKLAAAALLILALAGGAYSFLRGGKQTESYRTSKAARGTLSSTVTSSGTINPVVSVSVGAAVSGTIKELFVDFNSPVKKGQVIAQIDPATFRAQVEQSKGNYLAAQANMEKAKVTLADATRTMNRYKDLVRDGSVSVSDYDTYATAAASARAALGAAQGSMAQAKGSFDQARTNLDYATIRSPVDGIVISRAVDVGQTVAASFTTPTLFTIAQDLTKMQIYATVDESDIGKVHEGGNATFTVDAYPEARFNGTVTQVRNAATTVSNVVTYTVVVGVDNSELKLKPGMTASVTFVSNTRENALKIPTAALRFHPKDADGKKVETARLDTGKKRVYTLQNGMLKDHVITVGIGNDKETEVTGGDLAEGADIVLEALGLSSAAAKTTTNPMGSARGPGMGPPR
ncbi:MAG: efflux RND transporter periplasmic adaptor subunit [Proteobacteria bacterium]|nr:efflux RND transporter periplasmic adaptor subunit [Pseudomonadota bacterium]